MGFTLSPRQFNDCYNLYVDKWHDVVRGGSPDHCYDTTDPVGKKNTTLR